MPAEARVFPAISIRDSYSDVPEELAHWWHEQAMARLELSAGLCPPFENYPAAFKNLWL